MQLTLCLCFGVNKTLSSSSSSSSSLSPSSPSPTLYSLLARVSTSSSLYRKKKWIVFSISTYVGHWTTGQCCRGLQLCWTNSKFFDQHNRHNCRYSNGRTIQLRGLTRMMNNWTSLPSHSDHLRLLQLKKDSMLTECGLIFLIYTKSMTCSQHLLHIKCYNSQCHVSLHANHG